MNKPIYFYNITYTMNLFYNTSPIENRTVCTVNCSVIYKDEIKNMRKSYQVDFYGQLYFQSFYHIPIIDQSDTPVLWK